LSSRQTSKLEEEEEGSHCQANLVAPVLGSVHIPLCRRQSEILEISPDILDFPKTLEKSSENSRFTDNIVLSDDFQDSPIHPPSRRHQDPFNWYQSLVLRFELKHLEFKDVYYM
jgi:hypothetical protein